MAGIIGLFYIRNFQMLEYICKIGTFLKLYWKRDKSPNFKASAKSKKGNAAATAGPNSPIQMSEGDIYNITTDTKAVDDEESWDQLIDCFSDGCIQRLVEKVKDPRMQTHMKDHNGPGMKKWITEKFRRIPMHAKDPRARAFLTIKTGAVESLDSLINTKNEDIFRTAWRLNHQRLVSLRST